VILHIDDRGIMNKSAVSRFFKCLKPGRYELDAKKLNRRSSQANAYYWAAVLPLVKEGLNGLGYDEVQSNEDAHLFCKMRFLRIVKPSPDGEAMEFIRSTTSLNKTEFSEYLERIAQFAAEYLNVVIPAANTQADLW